MFAHIDDYLEACPAEARARLQVVRELIAAEVPDAVETISYGIPTFDLKGKHLAHFAGYARHIGFYPTPKILREHDGLLKHYKTGKGSVQFPLSEPLPVDLIRQMVQMRVAEILKK